MFDLFVTSGYVCLLRETEITDSCIYHRVLQQWTEL